jgi:uncharacterized protein (TIGR00369 family)
MRLVDEVGADLDGLSQLRALIASGRKAGILEALDFDFIEVEAGRAVFAGTPGDHAYNPIGSVHGGYAATLLDSSCGCAAHSRLTASQAFTTLELKVAYHKRITKRNGASTSGGQLAFVWATGSVCRGQADRCARQIVRVRHLHIAGFR